MKHAVRSVGTFSFMLAVAAVLGLMIAATAESDTKTDKPRSEAIKEQTIVKTKTLYSFPERKPVEKAAPAADSAPAAQGEYRIGPGDVLDFQLLDDTQMNREVKVRYDGFISLPQIDEIKVAGMTRAEALENLNRAYQAVYKKPHLALTVKDAGSKTFSMLGDVQNPGEYPYTRPVSVLEALNIAGGPRINSSSGDTYIGAQGQLSKAFVIRHQEGKREVHEYDLSGIRQGGENPSDAPVLPGDVVYIPEGMNLVYVMGEAVKPGVFPLVEGMRLLELLARAGGANEKTTRMHGVMLLRQVDAENTEAMLVDLRKCLDTGQSPKLQAGDILYVPRGKLVRLHDNLMRFTQLAETVSPLLGLYTQGFDAFYKNQLYNVLLHPKSGTTTGISVPTSASAAKTVQ